MNGDSNIDQVMLWLRDFVESFDFLRPGVDESLGRDLVGVVVERIQDRSRRHVAPDGSFWIGNSTTPSRWYPEGYNEWKRKKYQINDEPNFRTGQMLSNLSLGLNPKTVYNRHDIEIRYGIDAPPSSSAAPNGYVDPDTDGIVTDTQKAGWNQPGRPFYGFGQGDAEALLEVAQENLNQYILESPCGRAG
jgi:hypothetical protein